MEIMVSPTSKINEDPLVIKILDKDKHRPSNTPAIGGFILLINFCRRDCTEVELDLIRASFKGRFYSVEALGV